MKQLMLTFCLFVFVIGCDSLSHMHPYADYLKQSVGREDHDAVAKKMGAPNRTVALDKGGDLWTYDFCPYGSYPGSAQCQRLNLVFDKSGKLAEWHDK